MRRRIHRVLAGVGWVVGGAIARVVVFNVLVILCTLAMPITGDRFDAVLFPIACGGFVLVPTVATLLALRSKLPGTGDGHSVLPTGNPD